MRVLVIGGGISDERDVSLRSAQSVYDAVGVNHQKFLYDWDGSEEWLLQNGSQYDVALPILHGVGGEDGQIQRLLEKANLRYLGTGVDASALCIDKVRTQTALSKAGIQVPKQALVNIEEYRVNSISDSAHVLKPIYGGSSLDTFVLKNGRLDGDKANIVFNKHQTMVLEECIIGQEITIPVLDGYDLPVIEIIPKYDFFDFDAKYDGSSQEICNSDNVPQDVQADARKIARQCHDILNCKHLSRVDILLNEKNEPYVIEVNTMPGLTDQSLFPKSAAYVGLPMPELVEYFIKLASNN